jgi:hypothetical protein
MQQQTLSQRMAQLQRPGKIEAMKLMMAGDKSPLICRIAVGAGAINQASRDQLRGMVFGFKENGQRCKNKAL